MPRSKPITIVGGGLSGLFLGLLLRRLEIPVQINEAGYYPRHRVCGEFINGQGLRLLRQEGLMPRLQQAGGRWARTARLVRDRQASGVKELPGPSLCLARHEFDATLAEWFVEKGGRLECGIRMNPSRWQAEGVVVAAGRDPGHSRKDRQWFGLKAHAYGVPLESDLEMHFLPDAYVGLCRLDKDKINVCGLFRKRSTGQETRVHPLEKLRGPSGSLLRERMTHAAFDADSFCAVGGLNTTRHRAGRWKECRIGDAVTMIPPFTGNGMSMAFESAAIAAPPLVAYCRNRCSWVEAGTVIAQRIDAAYRSRLRWACLFQNLLMTSWGQAMLLALCTRSERLWRLAFRKTR